MSQKRTYKQYPEEFKGEAVALVREIGLFRCSGRKIPGDSDQYAVQMEKYRGQRGW